jgi:nucleoside 2-deoxyribosyltransferase
MKIYLAGPDVFRYDANNHFLKLKNICAEYNHIGISPLDNEKIENIELFSKEHSKLIFKNNIDKIKESDVVVANIKPFRGACIDDGKGF